jgi:hypothetical protein
MAEQPTHPEDRPSAQQLRYGVGVDLDGVPCPRCECRDFVRDRRTVRLVCRHCTRGDRLGVRIGFDGRPQ